MNMVLMHCHHHDHHTRCRFCCRQPPTQLALQYSWQSFSARCLSYANIQSEVFILICDINFKLFIFIQSEVVIHYQICDNNFKVGVGDPASFKKMNIVFEWIFWISKKWFFFNEYSRFFENEYLFWVNILGFLKNEYLFWMNILDSKKINKPFEYIFGF